MDNKLVRVQIKKMLESVTHLSSEPTGWLIRAKTQAEVKR